MPARQLRQLASGGRPAATQPPVRITLYFIPVRRTPLLPPDWRSTCRTALYTLYRMRRRGAPPRDHGVFDMCFALCWAPLRTILLCEDQASDGLVAPLMDHPPSAGGGPESPGRVPGLAHSACNYTLYQAARGSASAVLRGLLLGRPALPGLYFIPGRAPHGRRCWH